jgi:16S rRNA (guanine527-N7)-methyltransferase
MSESATRQLSSGERAVLRALAKEHAPHAEAAAIMVARLEAYLEDLLSWTRDSNLVAQNDLGRLASRHVTESLAVLPLLDRLAPARLIDLGSGAGFPAIPIQIARPDMTVTVVESRRRKGLFLQRTIEPPRTRKRAGDHGTAEQLAKENVEPQDVGTARAVAVIGELLPWLAPVIRPGGHAVLFKGSAHVEELGEWLKGGMRSGATSRRFQWRIGISGSLSSSGSRNVPRETLRMLRAGCFTWNMRGAHLRK